MTTETVTTAELATGDTVQASPGVIAAAGVDRPARCEVVAIRWTRNRRVAMLDMRDTTTGRLTAGSAHAAHEWERVTR